MESAGQPGPPLVNTLPGSLVNALPGRQDTASGKTDGPTTVAGGFVLVHAGAGYHSESKAKEYRHVCKRACQRAVDRLRAGALAVEAAEAALVELEDSPLTNAGTGSSLNLSGDIECDASVMDGMSLHYGAVGSLGGIKNPVLVASRVLSEARKGTLSAGRIPPCLLVGQGARDWAVTHGIPPCPPEKMVTKFSLSSYKRNKRKMELAEKTDADPPNHVVEGQQSNEKTVTAPNHAEKRRRRSNGNEEEEESSSGRLDTVGAIVVDQEGNVAAAVSSGGIAMKHPGRVGQAAHYGCGCWAENASPHHHHRTSSSSSSYATAASTSGCGEHLIRTTLARECSAAMRSSEEAPHQAVLEAMQSKFVGSPFLAGEERVLGGVVALRRSVEAPGDDDALVEFLWSHTTESMCVGFMSAQDSRATAHISRLPPGAVPGQSLAIEGGVCRLTNSGGK